MKPDGAGRCRTRDPRDGPGRGLVDAPVVRHVTTIAQDAGPGTGQQATVCVNIAEIEIQYVERAGEDTDIVGRNCGVHIRRPLGQSLLGTQERKTEHHNT